MASTYKIILNPTAGHGNGLHAQPQIEQLFSQHNVSYNLALTKQPGHGIELTRQAIQEGYGVIVAAGGDGTVNEVVNGLMQAKLVGMPIPPLGVLCVGRGNDFAGSVGIPTELEAGFKALVDGNRRIVDIGRVVGAGTLRAGILPTAWGWVLTPSSRSRCTSCPAGADMLPSWRPC